MCRFDLSQCCRLAVGVVMGLAVNAAVQAEETGVVRISDRSEEPVIRAQSPEAPLIVPVDCEVGGAPTCGPSCPPHGVCGPSHGLVIGTAPSCSYDDCESCEVRDCPHCHPGDRCGHCGGSGCLPASRCRAFGKKCVDCIANGCDRILGHLHDHLGLDKSGGDGAGVPMLGHYVLTYPVNPAYFDGRDGQVYAAHGYGGPVSVPLAPVVRHTYNYGWGVPSSRLTPVSHPIPPMQ